MGEYVRPWRYTSGRISREFGRRLLLLVVAWRLFTWGFRRIKPIFYHPIAIIGIAVFIFTYTISPWITAALALFVTLFWPYVHLDSYLRFFVPRVRSFFAGFKYRYRPRRKLTANGLLSEVDPIPTISQVRKIGCTTKIRIKMSHGDSIEFWRHEDRSSRIAQTYGALDCKINPYRRDNFLTFRPHGLTLKPPFIRYEFREKVTKPRWLELEFLTRDPFARAVGFEYIDFARVPEAERDYSIGNPVGPMRDGSPYLLKVGTHLLVVAMSGRGKSNAERAMVYADYPDVMSGRLENWIFDGKRGTEAKFMEHCFARHEYGQDGPEMVARFFEDVERVLYRRLDDMGERGETLFTPQPGHVDDDGVWTPGDPALRLYIDEIMILESVPYAEVRKRIYSAIAAIQQQGRAAGVSVIAFAQNPKMDRLPLRDDFPEIQIGGLQNRRQIDTAIAGGWDLGAREIPKDLPGVFYVKTEVGMALEQIRAAHDRHNAIRKLPQCHSSAFELTEQQLKEMVHEKVLIA